MVKCRTALPMRPNRRRCLRQLAALTASAILAPLPQALWAQARSPTRQGPLVAAASDLKFVLDAIAADWVAAGHTAPRIVYGSSGQLATQIQNGAPFELFLSADEAFVQRLFAAGRLRDAGVIYARGRIVLLAHLRAGLDPSPDPIAALREALAARRIRRFAIANPDHAPYGMRARETLQRVGLWEALQPYLVLGENVSQTAQFVATGSAEAGVIAWSLALAPAFANAGRWALIDASLHAPLVQRMALTQRAEAAAVGLYEFLQSAPARARFAAAGFEV